MTASGARYPPLIYSTRHGGLRAVCGEFRFGFATYATVSLPERLYHGLDDASRPRNFSQDEAVVDVKAATLPVDVLTGSRWDGLEPWPTESRRSFNRLETLWLITEDRYRRLDAERVEPLAHQVALVEHVLSTPGLERVLIADEVGLGKTIEVGRIIGRLQAARPGLRVLYLTEARLVENVMEEFRKLDLKPAPRRWTAERPEGRLKKDESDPFVVASIHRAVVQSAIVGESGPWDVLIVDEAHHVTDWSLEGDSPQERMKLIRKLAGERLVADGRLLLLTGTPHQGHSDRFRNLLRLLSYRADEQDARGRVIYRIKDDIRDWEGNPLFPVRQINDPIPVSVSEAYHGWMADVHALLTIGPGGSRASGWRRSQALQWCASSPQAGVAYLARLALRSGVSSGDSSALREAIASLRPYRGGSAQEPLPSLEERLRKAGGELAESVEQVFGGGRKPLERALVAGMELIREDAFGQKLDVLYDLLDHAPDDKFVVFAQPIETVYTLRDRLEHDLGKGAVNMIVGGQDDDERQSQIRRFLNTRGSRVLVSSRSGGEGINLQVARRLVHFDVPWNPMEMEQRVGRVHRYGSSQTVVVDTLVLEGSREERVLVRARARLLKIVRDLDRSRQETLFARTMSLVPLDDLAALMGAEEFGEWGTAEDERIDQLVMDGYLKYKESEREFRDHLVRLAAPEPGSATHDDLEAWLTRIGKASRADGWRRWNLVTEEGKPAPIRKESDARLLVLPDGRTVSVHPDTAVGLIAPDGARATPVRVGLNDPWILEQMRSTVANDSPPTGVALLLLTPQTWEMWLSGCGLPSTFASGGVLFSYLARHMNVTDLRETGTAMHFWICSLSGECTEKLTTEHAAGLVRALRGARFKLRLPDGIPVARVKELNATALDAIVSDAQAPETAVGVFPVGAFWVEVSSL